MSNNQSESQYARFRHGNRYYAWLEVPVALLALPVPENTGMREAEAWGTLKDKEGKKIRQKTLEEFVFPIRLSKDGNKAIVPLIPQEGGTKKSPYRFEAVTEADLIAWEGFTAAQGLPFSQWLDKSEYEQLLQDPLYADDHN